jgi:nucleoside 2-deoxyribosyltransferase
VKRIKIYLSGPISDLPLDEARKRFADVEAALRAERGCEVLNPFNNGLHWSDSWGDHMKADIKMLLEADAIYMLDGWVDSKGARLELTIARALDMIILHQH